MLARILGHLRAQWAGVLALFLVLSGGVAYAADTVLSSDIVDGEVKTADIGNNQVRSVDVRDDSLAGGGLTGDDVADTGSLGTAEVDEATLFNDDSLDAGDVSNGSTLSGAEINEASLSTVPNATNASNAFTAGNQSFIPIGFEASNGGGATGFSNLGDLNLEFRCDGATGDLTLRASTDLNNATLAVSDDDSYFDDEDFDTADGLVDILAKLGGDSDEVINLVYVNGAGFGIHDKVTAQFVILDEAAPGTQSECIVDGHAIASNAT